MSGLFTLMSVLRSIVAPLVSALGNGDTNQVQEPFASSCSVGVKFDTDGEEYEYNANGSFGSTIGTWLDQGVSSQVWVEYLRSGGTQSKWDNRNNNQRYQISVDVSWIIVDTIATVGGAETITGQFRFWDAASGGNILQTTSTATYSARLAPDPCPLCCFTPWTPITMADGSTMPIVDVRVGDLIQVEGGSEVVTGIITRDNRPMYLVKFADGRELETSEDHPLYVDGKGYAAINPDPTIDYKDLGVAKLLIIGDKVVDVDGQLNGIISIEGIAYPETVYTFENSKFYANGFLVY